MRSRLLFQTVAVALTASGIAVVLALILGMNDGVFTYVLDDPYIHLAVAETILQGGYGINPGENAAPSSSILYPLLIAATLALGLTIWGPLLIGVAASAASSWLMAGIFWTSCIAEQRRAVVVAAYVVLPVLLISANLVAIPFLGMEHPLHILATLMVASGFMKLSDAGPVPKRLVAGLILCPLLRFEGIALTLAGLLALWAYRRFRAIFLVALVLVVAFSAYVFTMTSLGLPWLPSSVLVKSNSSAAVFAGDSLGTLASLIANLLLSFKINMGLILALGAGLVLFALSVETPTKQRLALGFLAIAIAAAHMTAGQFGWFGRYEVYAVAFLVVVLLSLFGTRLFPKGGNAAFGAVGLIALLGTAGSDYLWRTAITASAAHGIYGQHYQMHRFATDYFPYAVAVNDIGYVAYDNDNHVLDLWGLGSEDARKARANGTFTADLVEQLADAKDVRFAMVYDNWLIEIPSDWCKVAAIENRAISAAENKVTFFLRNLGQEVEMRTALAGFGESLPDGTKISIFPAC